MIKVNEVKIFTHEFVIYHNGWVFEWRKKPELKKYEYGTIDGSIRRRCVATGVVEFILWPAGQLGHKDDFWHPCDRSYWNEFKPFSE